MPVVNTGELKGNCITLISAVRAKALAVQALITATISDCCKIAGAASNGAYQHHVTLQPMFRHLLIHKRIDIPCGGQSQMRQFGKIFHAECRPHSPEDGSYE